MFDIRPYQFLEWKLDAFCCGDYVRLVLKDYLGAELRPVRHAGGPIAAAKALRNTDQRRLFKPVRQPAEFCVVEMQRYREADHVGVYVVVDGQPYITHCEGGAGVLLSTLDEIQEHYTIIGYYQYVG